MASHAVAVHWFRKGLRLHDNPALLAALSKSARVIPLFVIDPWFLTSSGRVGPRRYQFLLESLTDLDASLRQLDSQLYVARGKPADVIPRICEASGATLLTFEADTEPYAQTRDGDIQAKMKKMGVTVDVCWSHTLHDMTHLAALAHDQPTTTYQSFLKNIFHRAGPVPKPVDAPKEKFAPLGMDLAALLPDLGLEDGVPTMETTPCPFVGGETTALERMRMNLSRTAWVRTFEKPKTSPNSLEPSTTVLSPYLKFGCLSARTFWHELHQISNQISKPPTSLIGQLLWREFYYTSAFCCPNYDRMKGNPICRQIKWIDPEATSDSSDSGELSAKASEHLAAWQEGRTGFPWIDAIMTQLREQGWIHHLARHSAACFLTRGDLFISWEHGAKHFDRLLLDADWALNNGNWMWLSASCYFYQFFRVYSPVSFGKKTDKNGDYIRKWLPQLKNMPSKYIYEPWMAPRSVQEQAGCIVGVDYPAPIVDHKVVSKRNMGWMKAAYDEHKRSKSQGKGKGKSRGRGKRENTSSAAKRAKKGNAGKGGQHSAAAALGEKRKKQTTLKLKIANDDSK